MAVKARTASAVVALRLNPPYFFDRNIEFDPDDIGAYFWAYVRVPALYAYHEELPDGSIRMYYIIDRCYLDRLRRKVPLRVIKPGMYEARLSPDAWPEWHVFVEVGLRTGRLKARKGPRGPSHYVVTGKLFRQSNHT